MAVDQVVVQVFGSGKLAHTLDEIGQSSGPVSSLRSGLFRSGRDVHHPVAVAQVVQHVRHVLVLRAGEHIHVHAQLPRWRVSSRT